VFKCTLLRVFYIMYCLCYLYKIIWWGNDLFYSSVGIVHDLIHSFWFKYSTEYRFLIVWVGDLMLLLYPMILKKIMYDRIEIMIFYKLDKKTKYLPKYICWLLFKPFRRISVIGVRCITLHSIPKIYNWTVTAILWSMCCWSNTYNIWLVVGWLIID